MTLQEALSIAQNATPRRRTADRQAGLEKLMHVGAVALNKRFNSCEADIAQLQKQLMQLSADVTTVIVASSAPAKWRTQ